MKVISPHPPIPSHQKADVTSRAVLDVITKTSEYLQPNPSARAKLTMLNTVSKIRGQVNSPGYPQSEGLLGESMVKFGREMGDDTNFGRKEYCVQASSPHSKATPSAVCAPP